MLAPGCDDCAVRWSCALEADGPDFEPCPLHKVEKPTCDYCGSDKDVHVGCVDPFSAEINDDMTEHDLCDKCYEARAMEV